MQLQAPLNDLSKPENIQQLASVLSDLAEKLDVLYSETAPNGNISARIGRICIYKNGSSYEQWMNVDGSTTWQRIDYGAITLPLAIASGGTGNDTAQEAIDALLPSQASASGKFLTSNGTNASWGTIPADINTSNVVFCWNGIDNATGGGAGNAGIVVDLAQDLIDAVTEGANIYWRVGGTTYVTILTSRFVKIAGISTITIHARIWSNDVGGGNEAILNCDIGGQSNTVKSVTSVTPTWVTASTIDVSSLTNGTAYNITIQLKNESGSYSFCSGVILTAS